MTMTDAAWEERLAELWKSIDDHAADDFIATFTGRASRSEYWWCELASAIVSAMLQVLVTVGRGEDSYGRPIIGPVAILGYVLMVVLLVAIFIPSLALVVRRLHDSNLSGLLALLLLIPFVGCIVVTIMNMLPSRPEGQRFDRPSALR